MMDDVLIFTITPFWDVEDSRSGCHATPSFAAYVSGEYRICMVQDTNTAGN